MSIEFMNIPINLDISYNNIIPDTFIFEGNFNLSSNFSVNITLNKLIKYCNNNQFVEINQTMMHIRNRQGLFADYFNQEELFDKYEKYIKIRNYIRNKLNENKLKNCKVINDNDLSLLEFNDNEEFLELIDTDNQSIYRFRINELINLLKINLLYREYDYCVPKEVKNPYTNLNFTLKQHIEIYNYIKSFYSKNNKSIPSYISNFKSCYFNVALFSKKFTINNCYKIHNEYLDSLTDDEWWSELNDFVKVYPTIKETYCVICIKNKLGAIFRTLLTPILTISFMNDSDMYYLGNAKDMYFELALKHNFLYEKNHILIHRRRKQTRRMLLGLQNSRLRQRPRLLNEDYYESNSDSTLSLNNEDSNPEN